MGVNLVLPFSSSGTLDLIGFGSSSSSTTPGICVATDGSSTTSLNDGFDNILDNPNQYNIGDLVPIKATFTDRDTGNSVQPTTVTVTISKPDGSSLTYTYGTDSEVVYEGSGVYTCDIDIDMDGMWYYRWVGTGTGQSADQSAFEVVPIYSNS